MLCHQDTDFVSSFDNHPIYGHRFCPPVARTFVSWKESHALYSKEWFLFIYFSENWHLDFWTPTHLNAHSRQNYCNSLVRYSEKRTHCNYGLIVLPWTRLPRWKSCMRCLKKWHFEKFLTKVSGCPERCLFKLWVSKWHPDALLANTKPLPRLARFSVIFAKTDWTENLQPTKWKPLYRAGQLQKGK